VYRQLRAGPHLLEDMMAERIVRQLIDDLDGTEIRDGSGEQIEFAVRGVTYRIDLNNGNVTKFEKALAPFIDSATKVRGPRGRSGGRRRAGSAGRSAKELSAIRAWATKHGHKVSGRGRIPGDVMEAYQAAHDR
jgi:Lsr2